MRQFSCNKNVGSLISPFQLGPRAVETEG